MMKILYLVSEDTYFCTHRINIARAAKAAGYDVHVATCVSDKAKTIQNEGFALHPLQKFNRASMNPFKDLKALIELIKIYRRVRPDVVHHVAMKPVLLGSIASLTTRVPRVVNMLGGMGYLFIAKGVKSDLVRMFVSYAIGALNRIQNAVLIVQNVDDYKYWQLHGTLRAEQLALIKGSGVDINFFVPPENEPEPPITIVLPARVLADKGVCEFVEAAKLILAQGLNARMVLCGPIDSLNPTGVPEIELRRWEKEHIIEWWGNKENMCEVYHKAHIVVLPSYREGLPKALLEAAACARPIVTTDVPGCREIVRDGVNGLLVPVRNAPALAAGIIHLFNNKNLRMELGKAGREMVEKEFSDDHIVKQTMTQYRLNT
jgi:glycosyltransferase involved in cell wall biosynthesis